ncbi:MAG: aminoglycoside 6-adenylyltransferase [Chloroflexi bacterium]|nr:aminoglycoside 6-adenylyltransferase [Chloroflexota bacterium]MCI0575631.1 aminoglycoside 6-adenylyltransferase [Chloroflexota bacterium]
MVEPFPAPSESDYLPGPPTAKAFSDCCNEFWWVCRAIAYSTCRPMPANEFAGYEKKTC